MATTEVRLGKPLERSIRAGHPWIYRDAILLRDEAAKRVSPKHRGASFDALRTGAAVDVIGSDGKFVARGLYDADSPIAVRVATLDPREPLDAGFVRRRLERALGMRHDLFERAHTNAFRWCNGEGDFLPGVVVDVYASVAVVRLDGQAVRVWRDHVTAAVVELGRALAISHVYERSRGGKGEALFGGAPPSPVDIVEHDTRFVVDIVRGQKTGFFLDQRDNRHALRAFCRGAEVLNLFGYTGGFSVHAALAGARRVTTVDVAKDALADARRNFERNRLDPSAHEFAAEDAFDWLEQAARQGRRFGVVVSDPPSFAPSEKALQKGLTAYRDLHARALAVLAEGGTLAAASCSSHVTMDAFVRTLADAAQKTGRPLRLLELRGQPPDHPTPPAFPEGRYLKFVLARAD